MENTKENVIKLLRLMVANSNAAADHFKDIDPSFSKFLRDIANTRQESLWLLTDQKYFNTLWKNYNEEEN